MAGTARGLTSINTDQAARAVLNCLSSRRVRRLKRTMPDGWRPEIGPISQELMADARRHG